MQIPNPPPDDEEDTDPYAALMPWDDLLAMAETNEADIDAAIEWWDRDASEDFLGALD